METRRADQIANTLEQLVFAGEFEDGERLDELKLAEQFSVSRTPIREALQVLVSSGMAEQIPRRGVFIRQPRPVELMEMFESLAEANNRCQEAVNGADSDSYYAENEVFHQIIYRGAANSFLEKQALRLQNRLKAYRRVQLKFRGRMVQSMSEHSQILNALENGDAERAATVLRSHVAVQGEKFHQLVASLKR